MRSRDRTALSRFACPDDEMSRIVSKTRVQIADLERNFVCLLW